MKIKILSVLSLLINNCSGCHNNNEGKTKHENPNPINPIRKQSPINVDDIIPDLNQYIKGEKSLQDIKSTIDQLKRLNKQDDKLDIANIEENLNNKEKLKNIIDKYHNGRIITGVISKSNIKNDNYTPK